MLLPVGIRNCMAARSLSDNYIMLEILSKWPITSWWLLWFIEKPKGLFCQLYSPADGASWFRVYFSIVLPISKPILISLGLLLFLSQWDSYFWPLLVAPDQKFRVVQLAISESVQEYQTFWNELLAGSMLAAVLPILLILPFQRYFINAIVGAVKE